MSHTLLARPARLLAGAFAVALCALFVLQSTPAEAATRHHHRPATISTRVATAMRIAEAQRGKPYVYGASGPRAFDCSGLTSYAYHHAGFGAMPRSSSAQAHFARHIRRSQLHRGDLIFFTGSGGVYHVGLYAGSAHGHRFVLHAPYPGQRVHVERMWTDHWFAGTLRRA